MDVTNAITTAKPAETQDEVLARLAIEIRESINRGAAGAIAAGVKLIEAKRLLPHGEWLPWLRMHCELSERAAQYHMRSHRRQIRNAFRI